MFVPSSVCERLSRNWYQMVLTGREPENSQETVSDMNRTYGMEPSVVKSLSALSFAKSCGLQLKKVFASFNKGTLVTIKPTFVKRNKYPKETKDRLTKLVKSIRKFLKHEGFRINAIIQFGGNDVRGVH